MKKWMILLLAFMLTACSAPAGPTATETVSKEENAMVTDLTEKIKTSGAYLAAQQTYQFSRTDLEQLRAGDTALIYLEVKAESRCESLNVVLYQGGGQTEETYYIPTQWSRISICSDSEMALAGLKLATEGKLLLRSFTLENCGKATADSLLPRLGQFLLEEHERVELPEQGAGAGRCKDLVKTGNMVYSVGNGVFTVTDVSDPANPKVLGSVSGLGDTRQIALCESGTDAMVTARGYGAYIIDASDPANPRIRTHYNTVEMATGISIEGNFAYISNRQYGVEVVDLTDLDDPRYVRTVMTGEVQSARVVDGVLYCGLWGGCRVDMYDMTAPEPVLLGSAPLKGRGDGLFVVKEEGRTLLYAATGHHQTSLANNSPLTNAAFGQANGLDIVDVTDPANPVWLSTTRVDGRFYSPSFDFWETTVWERDGVRYACLVSSHNGVYIFNVNDPTAPQRVCHITVPIPQSSDNYVFYRSDRRTFTFPFDRFKEVWSPIGAVVSDDGVLYLAGGLSDLHILPLALVQKPLETPAKELSYTPASSQSAFDPEDQVHAITTDGQTFWAACGSQGVAQLDANLVCSEWVPTEGCCYDVYYQDGVLYAAEGDAGLAAYDPATLKELWRFASQGHSVKQVRLSPKGRFAVLHMAHNEGWVLRIEDLTVVHNQSTGAQMYHHYLGNGVIGGRYMCFWGNSADEIWLDFGPEDDRAVPNVCTILTSRTGMVGGVVDYQGKALAVTNKGLLQYDPMTTPDLKSLEVMGMSAYGKPAISGNLLVTTNRLNGKLVVTDISDIQNPRELWSKQLPGNPETAIVCGNAVYVPLGHAGLVKYPLN